MTILCKEFQIHFEDKKSVTNYFVFVKFVWSFLSPFEGGLITKKSTTVYRLFELFSTWKHALQYCELYVFLKSVRNLGFHLFEFKRLHCNGADKQTLLFFFVSEPEHCNHPAYTNHHHSEAGGILRKRDRLSSYTGWSIKIGPKTKLKNSRF